MNSKIDNFLQIWITETNWAKYISNMETISIKCQIKINCTRSIFIFLNISHNSIKLNSRSQYFPVVPQTEKPFPVKELSLVENAMIKEVKDEGCWPVNSRRRGKYKLGNRTPGHDAVKHTQHSLRVGPTAGWKNEIRSSGN